MLHKDTEQEDLEDLLEPKLSYNDTIKLICEGEDAKGTGHDVRANHASAVLRRIVDLLASEYIIREVDPSFDGEESFSEVFASMIQKRELEIRKKIAINIATTNKVFPER